MSEGMPYADIIIIALVAGFILLRLRSILGQDNGDSNFLKKTREKIEDSEPIIQLGEKIAKNKPVTQQEDSYASSLAGGDISEKIKKIKEKDASFNTTIFLDGAKMAFEMVFDAFNKGDKKTLSMLLSKELYDDFVEDMDSRAKSENKLETTLLSVAAKEIMELKIDSKNVASIKVYFESEQVSVERDDKGEIVGGDPSDVQNIRDEWVFEKDITSKNPNWKIIET
ncbi:MAG: Tim44/TimA family putative adaptor protein [Rickettsiales bacterium]